MTADHTPTIRYLAELSPVELFKVMAGVRAIWKETEEAVERFALQRLPEEIQSRGIRPIADELKVTDKTLYKKMSIHKIGIRKK